MRTTETPRGHLVQVILYGDKGEVFYDGAFICSWSPRSATKTLEDALKVADKKLKEETNGNSDD